MNEQVSFRRGGRNPDVQTCIATVACRKSPTKCLLNLTKINDAIRSMKADGMPDNLIQRYLFD